MKPVEMIEVLSNPNALWLPLIYDSPHSGHDYPDDFEFSLDFQTLRRSEDAFVEELFGTVVDFGGALLHARFPRCYIDPNRALTDVDTNLINGPWSQPVEPSIKLARGSGLIWKQVKKYGDIYNRLLSPEEVQARIDRCWRPYHQSLSGLLSDAYDRAGGFIHINCHSMASQGDYTTEDGPVMRPDFVLGNRDGTTCGTIVIETVANVLQEAGYQVLLNNPYKGLELIRKFSDPINNKHSLQIEISRALYMDETEVKKTEGFARLQNDLTRVTRALANLAQNFQIDSDGV